MTYRNGVLTLMLALTAGLIGLTGCDAVDDSTTGRVQVLLTDAPIDEMDSVFVTIDRVVLVGDTNDADGFVLMDEELEVDLLELRNGIDTTLANELVPEGDYTQLRIYLTDSAYVYLKDQTVQSLKVPSGFVRINLPEFVIDEDDDVVRVTLDFDVNESFVKAGNSDKYILHPVIHPIEFEVNGDDIDLPDDTEEGTGGDTGN